MIVMVFSHFAVLGVEENCTDEELRSAWRVKVRSTHPDVGGSREHFDAVQRAYETLREPASRAEHQRRLHVPEQPINSSGASKPQDRAERVWAAAAANPKVRYWHGPSEAEPAPGRVAGFYKKMFSRFPTRTPVNANGPVTSYAYALTATLIAMLVGVLMVVPGAFYVTHQDQGFPVMSATWWWIGSWVTFAMFSQLFAHLRARGQYVAATGVFSLMVGVLLVVPFAVTAPALLWWMAAPCTVVVLAATIYRAAAPGVRKIMFAR
jgi:hypothetical protein